MIDRAFARVYLRPILSDKINEIFPGRQITRYRVRCSIDPRSLKSVNPLGVQLLGFGPGGRPSNSCVAS